MQPKNSGRLEKTFSQVSPNFKTHSLAKQNQIPSYFDVPTTPADIQLHANPGNMFEVQ